MRSVRGGIRRARTLSNGSRILSWFGRVASESIHVTCLIRADGGSKLFVEGMPVDCETLQGLRHGHYVVINQQVGHQMVVLNELALLVPNTLGRQCAPAKGDPLHKLVKSLALVGRSLNQPS